MFDAKYQIFEAIYQTRTWMFDPEIKHRAERLKNETKPRSFSKRFLNDI